MPLSPQHRSRAPHAAAGNHALANADQNVTEVDARLTKLDSVNPSSRSRTTLNNPEQIRTNLNTAKRPDQIGRPPGSPPNTPKKRILNTVAATRCIPPPPQFIPPPFQGGG